MYLSVLLTLCATPPVLVVSLALQTSLALGRSKGLVAAFTIVGAILPAVIPFTTTLHTLSQVCYPAVLPGHLTEEVTKLLGCRKPSRLGSFGCTKCLLEHTLDEAGGVTDWIRRAVTATATTAALSSKLVAARELSLACTRTHAAAHRVCDCVTQHACELHLSTWRPHLKAAAMELPVIVNRLLQRNP